MCRKTSMSCCFKLYLKKEFQQALTCAHLKPQQCFEVVSWMPWVAHRKRLSNIRQSQNYIKCLPFRCTQKPGQLRRNNSFDFRWSSHLQGPTSMCHNNPNILRNSHNQNLLDCNSGGQVLEISRVKELCLFKSKLPAGPEEDVKVVLVWAKNKTRMRFVHLLRQRIISQEFPGRDTAYNPMLPKFISLEGRHDWGGACVQQIRNGPEQNTRKHTSWWERLLRDSGWLTAAKLPVGRVLGGDQAKIRKHDIRIIQKSRTRWANANTNMTHAETELFSHPETAPSHARQALSMWIPVISVEQRTILETLGCYKTQGQVTKSIIYYHEARRHRRAGTLCQCFQIVLNFVSL